MELLVLYFFKEFNGNEICHFKSVGDRRLEYTNTEWQCSLQHQWTSSLSAVQELLLLDVITFLSFPVPNTEDSPGDAEVCFSWAADKLNVAGLFGRPFSTLKEGGIT